MSDDFFDGLTDLEELGREQEAIETGEDPLSGEWRKLLEISTRIAGELEIESLLKSVMDAAVEITGAERGFLIMLDPNGLPEVRIAHNLDKGEIRDIQGSISTTVIDKILSKGKPMLINDVENNEMLSRQVSVRNLQLKSVMGAPIICKENLLGMAYVDNSSLTGVFSQKEFAIFVTFVNLAAVAIENAKMFESLWESSERYRALQEYNDNILKAIPSGVLVFDCEGRVEYFNSAAGSIFPKVEQKDLPLAKMIPNRDIRNGIEKMSRGEQPEIISLELNEHYYDIEFFSVLERQGKFGMLITDATIRKQLEKKYYEDEKHALTTQLAGGIAHEISNHLFPIQGRAQLAAIQLKKRVPGLDVEILKSLQVIEEQVQKIARISDDLRNLSKPPEAKMVDLDLSETMKKSVEVMATTAGKIKRFCLDDPEANFQLQTSYFPHPLVIKGDPDQLQQVFMNLIINAAHALEEKGRGILSVGTFLKDGIAGAYVEDNGPGIPDEIREKIFEPYFTTKGKGKGTGLGMPIVRNIVQAHKGELLLNTKVGKGTRFEILLPLKKKKKA